MKFVDLFAGLGGFHAGLHRLGHSCVFASEIDEQLRSLYNRNYGILPAGDIRAVRETDVPSHEILCAGFPCQPFSKAGAQKGLNCSRWGDLFDHAMRIIKYHRPRFVLLENVPNLSQHDSGNTWLRMEQQLRSAGYDVQIKKLSPHRFGIPQIRERVFIAATQGHLNGFLWPSEKGAASLNLKTVLQEHPANARGLSAQVVRCLNVWQEFLERFPKNEELPSFPIWSMEFGATYPFEKTTPHAIGNTRLRQYRGSHGNLLKQLPCKQRMDGLPSYARYSQKRFPAWKVDFIRKNRALYFRHQKWIDRWIPKILEFPSSLQKLEWNCKGEKRNIWNYVIQFRASGVRVKRPSTAPALIAMTSTQVPIIAWERRYMTPRECARLQSFRSSELKYLPASSTRAYEALGNAVNASMVELIGKSLVGNGGHNRSPSTPDMSRQPAETLLV